MKKFDSRVQYLKYKVMREVAKLAFEDRLLEGILEIPEIIIQGRIPTMRCCVYKERAIIGERVKAAMGQFHKGDTIIDVIPTACDECPRGGYEVTDSCRGCIAHHCVDVCPRGAITIDERQKAHINKDKCVQCGKCAQVCPYSAILDRKRPCENSCKVKAISTAPGGEAFIDHDKCISCGSCAYQCPFGAIVARSFALDAIKLIKESDQNKNYKVFAVVAPSISTQFSYASLGQVITGITELGFYETKEAALGADMVTGDEARELVDKGFLTSSCCPAFVDYVGKNFPQMVQHISHSLSPAATIGKYLKETVPNSKVIFIGPCTAKKMEFSKPHLKKFVDCVLSFQELQALFDSRDIDLCLLPETELDHASSFGRTFARSGGLAEAVKRSLEEQELADFDFKPIACDGIEQCRIALLKASKNVLDANFIEGMACINGCIGGAGCLTHGAKDKSAVDKYGKLSTIQDINTAIKNL